MASEKVSNLGESTLASGYTSGGSSITVSSAASFPTSGVFRVRLDNPSETVFRVDSVAGAVFTGAAEFNDGNASAGVEVVQVASRGVAERFIQSPDSGELRAPSGVSGADYYGPIWKIPLLDQSGWTWVNQGSATVDQAGGSVYLDTPAAAGTNLRVRKTTAPSTPYTLTTGIKRWFSIASSLTSLMAAGLIVRESSTGEMSAIAIANFTFATANAPASIWAGNYNSATSAAGAIGSERNSANIGDPVWLRITDNGTNLIFEASIDKIHWYQIASVGRTTHMAGGPDEIGIFITDQAGATQASAAFVHLEVT